MKSYECAVLRIQIHIGFSWPDPDPGGQKLSSKEKRKKSCFFLNGWTFSLRAGGILL
jgi:hypothetical protein